MGHGGNCPSMRMLGGSLILSSAGGPGPQIPVGRFHSHPPMMIPSHLMQTWRDPISEWNQYQKWNTYEKEPQIASRLVLRAVAVVVLTVRIDIMVHRKYIPGVGPNCRFRSRGVGGLARRLSNGWPDRGR